MGTYNYYGKYVSDETFPDSGLKHFELDMFPYQLCPCGGSVHFPMRWGAPAARFPFILDRETDCFYTEHL